MLAAEAGISSHLSQAILHFFVLSVLYFPLLSSLSLALHLTSSFLDLTLTQIASILPAASWILLPLDQPQTQTRFRTLALPLCLCQHQIESSCRLTYTKSTNPTIPSMRATTNITTPIPYS